MPTYESGEKFLRVIQLFQRLCDTEVGLTTAQLAEDLEVTTRSVQRYIATLRDSVGIDVEEEAGRFRIGDHSKLPPLQLDSYQATAVLMALRLLHQLRTEHDPALVGALAQLSRALRTPAVARFLQTTIEAAETRPQNAERRGVERAIIDGFARHRVVEITYQDAEGRASSRVIHPYFLEPRPEGRTVYVFAHDSLSKEVRRFRMERIHSARVLTESFDVPEDFDIDRLVGNSWGIWSGPGRYEVVTS
jgi:predicted DNA-binding transcriptional regulator YafY